MPSEKEFVTMSMLKEMLDLQQKSFKATIEVLVDGLKSEIKEIRKEQEELKLSVKFCSGKYEDSKKSLEKVDTEITAVYAQIKSINKELNEGFEDLEWKNEYLENQSRRNNIKITGVPEGEEDAAMMVRPRKSTEHLGPSSRRFDHGKLKNTSSELQEKRNQVV